MGGSLLALLVTVSTALGTPGLAADGGADAPSAPSADSTAAWPYAALGPASGPGSPESRLERERPIAEGRRTSLAGMTAFFVGAQFAAVGFFSHDRNWNHLNHDFTDSYTSAPVWDDDTWYYNYAYHPIVGSEYYLAARNRGWSWCGSLSYSAAMSAFYEYVPESIIQQPSIQDLFVTPLAGAALGELRYWAKQRILSHGAPSPRDRFWMTTLDYLDISIGGFPDGSPKLIATWRFP